jgi:[ribosomal protein S18]-alanine N-acetyltransferase
MPRCSASRVADEVAIRPALTAEEIIAASALFDARARVDATARFLAEPGHHLFVACAGAEPVGMVSGVEMTHPDKGTEMFLYELGVAERHRGRGIGRRLVSALADLAREAGCYGMWVLADVENAAAPAAYRAAGAEADSAQRMLTWTFDA